MARAWRAMGGVEKLWAAVARRHGRRRAGAARKKVPSVTAWDTRGRARFFNAGAYPSSGSDPELPEGIGFAVAPGGTAGDGILQGADYFASGGVEEGLGVDFNDIEAHVVGVE